MFVTYLECAKCGTNYEANKLYNLCTQCGKPLPGFTLLEFHLCVGFALLEPTLKLCFLFEYLTILSRLSSVGYLSLVVVGDLTLTLHDWCGNACIP